MKTKIILLLVCCLSWLGMSVVRSQTLDWGSEVFSDLRDSTGETIDENTFVFELGAFINGFIPTADNTEHWLSNWQVFDQAAYSQSLGYFTSTTQMTDSGVSTSSYLTPGAISFEGLEGYMWVRNADDPVAGTEWLLTRSIDWVFPTAIPGCCDNEIPTQWSVSDLSSETPVWGRQGDEIGAGSYTVTGTYTLQTFTFVPEPSSALLAALSSLVLLRRRR